VADEAAVPGIDYRALLQDALVGVVRTVLRQVAIDGLPGEHHFFLSFRTDAPGVELSPRLARKNPQEMTIVLQHQYWNLQVDDVTVGVTLKFGGSPERVVVPFAALTAFVDPSVPFGLRLQALAEKDAANTEVPPTEAPASGTASAPSARENGTVVDFAAFRNRQ
jgi:uncharacterized protein